MKPDYHKLFLLCLTLAIVNQTLRAQTHFLTGPNAYLAQKTPGDNPEKFAPELLAGEGEFSANRTAISIDGREIYYCTNTTWKNIKNLKVKYFKYDGKKWTGPTVLTTELGETSFSPDNKTLYFCSDKAANMVFQSTRTDTGWTAPAKYLERNFVIYDFMPTASGRKYAASNGTWGTPNNAGAWRFSVMPADESDTTIQSLGYPLNSPGFNGDFFVARDESYMIISTKETKTYDCELYISFRRKDHTWTAPKSLGPLINDGPAHRYGQYVSPDGKYLFYTRATSEKDCAIYWVRFDGLLKKLRKFALGQ